MFGKALKTDVKNLQKDGNTNLQQKVSPSVSLTIKVPKNYRQHWQIEAKRRDTNENYYRQPQQGIGVTRTIAEEVLLHKTRDILYVITISKS